jgi:hypothetical protein
MLKNVESCSNMQKKEMRDVLEKGFEHLFRFISAVKHINVIRLHKASQ